jgi:transposase-like protein
MLGSGSYAMTDLTNPIYNNDAAHTHLEAIRWPNGAFCPHCGEQENVHRMEGTSQVPGLHYCRSCHKKFSVTVGTVIERFHVPLHKWVGAGEYVRGDAHSNVSLIGG